MTPISEWHYKLDDWCPAIVIMAIYAVMFPIRCGVCFMLPPGAVDKTHPLHKVKAFWGF